MVVCVGLVLAPLLALLPAESLAAPPKPTAPVRVPVDRALVRFVSPVTGVRAPEFVFERVLAFQVRLLGGAPAEPLSPARVRLALERHIAEVLLVARVTAPPPEAELQRRARDLSRAVVERLGGVRKYDQALLAEGLRSSEANQLFRRKARASLELERMRPGTLRVSDVELRIEHQSRRLPESEEGFGSARARLWRHLFNQKLERALDEFYRDVQNRVKLHWL